MDENSFILPYYYIIMLGIFYIIQANFGLESLGGKKAQFMYIFPSRNQGIKLLWSMQEGGFATNPQSYNYKKWA